MKYCLYC